MNWNWTEPKHDNDENEKVSDLTVYKENLTFSGFTLSVYSVVVDDDSLSHSQHSKKKVSSSIRRILAKKTMEIIHISTWNLFVFLLIFLCLAAAET